MKQEKGSGTAVLPERVTVLEARLLLEVISRLKSKRFGRLTVTVSDGRVVDVEIVEKIDRNVVKQLSR